MSPGGIPSAERFPAKLVCLRGYGLHVRRIDAASHSAEMVDLEIARNLANEVLVREPVRSDLTGPSWRKVRAVPKVAVALVTDGSRPEPATRHRLRYDLLHEAFSDRSLGPTRHAPILAILADDYPAPLAAETASEVAVLIRRRCPARYRGPLLMVRSDVRWDARTRGDASASLSAPAPAAGGACTRGL